MKRNTTTVSIIIPAYNEEKNIRKTLDSVKMQTYYPDEIIVVLNNCTDRTEFIAREYGVKILNEYTQGLTPTRNRGFDSAKSDIIVKLDADTILEKDTINNIINGFKDKSIAALSIFPDYGKPLINTLTYYSYFQLATFLLGHTPLWGPCYAIRKEIWQKVRHSHIIDDELVHEDQEITRVAKLYGKVITLDDFIQSSPRRFSMISSYLDYSRRFLNGIFLSRMKEENIVLIPKFKIPEHLKPKNFKFEFKNGKESNTNR